MTREDIEKAAIDYSGRDGGVTLKTEIYAFTAGAEWRINSAWHDVEEKPNGMFVIIIDFGDEIGAEEFGLGMTADDLIGAKRWAYISDLLPEKKEGWINVYKDLYMTPKMRP